MATETTNGSDDPPVPGPSGPDDPTAPTGGASGEQGSGGSGGMMRSSAIMAVGTLVSRVTGFVKAIVIAAALILELVGPLAVQFALRRAGEAHEDETA